MFDIHAEVLAADQRIRDYTRRTPLEPSRWLSDAGGCRVHLKLENLQRTGSFKFRGAMNKLLSLAPETRGRGVVAASTGNHGAAVACGAAELGCQAVIFAPETAVPAKLEAIRSYGVEVRCAGDDCVKAETAARHHARDNNSTYISPYNDPVVVAGQGTIGRELETQLDHIDALIIAVGGGGLIAGVGGYMTSIAPDVTVIGASPQNSAVMCASIDAGRVLDLPSEPTLSDGTAGGVEADTITFAMCQDVIHDFVLVSESEIKTAVRGTIAHHHTLIEGAAGVAVAAFLAQGRRFQGQNVVIVLCGANIDPAVLKEIL